MQTQSSAFESEPRRRPVDLYATLTCWAPWRSVIGRTSQWHRLRNDRRDFLVTREEFLGDAASLATTTSGAR
jgi:hypothetical protein